MPKDLPTAAQAWEDVTFFSIDTNLIQAAGYNFAQGALHQLPNQLPESIGLQLPEIVVSEIVKHRMESVHKACPRRSNIDPPCRFNIDPGMDAGRLMAGCGQASRGRRRT
jgi:hypothetical protein